MRLKERPELRCEKDENLLVKEMQKQMLFEDILRLKPATVAYL
jgi:hypothetical protein